MRLVVERLRVGEHVCSLSAPMRKDSVKELVYDRKWDTTHVVKEFASWSSSWKSRPTNPW